MLRAAVSGIALTCLLFFAGVVSAQASAPQPYPAPPVTASTTVKVAPTSSDAPSTARTDPSTSAAPASPAAAATPPQAGPLAYTGTGFNVALVAGVALIIVVAGGALVLVGSRRLREPHARDH